MVYEKIHRLEDGDTINLKFFKRDKTGKSGIGFVFTRWNLNDIKFNGAQLPETNTNPITDPSRMLEGQVEKAIVKRFPMALFHGESSAYLPRIFKNIIFKYEGSDDNLYELTHSDLINFNKIKYSSYGVGWELLSNKRTHTFSLVLSRKLINELERIGKPAILTLLIESENLNLENYFNAISVHIPSQNYDECMLVTRRYLDFYKLIYPKRADNLTLSKLKHLLTIDWAKAIGIIKGIVDVKKPKINPKENKARYELFMTGKSKKRDLIKEIIAIIDSLEPIPERINELNAKIGNEFTFSNDAERAYALISLVPRSYREASNEGRFKDSISIVQDIINRPKFDPKEFKNLEIRFKNIAFYVEKWKRAESKENPTSIIRWHHTETPEMVDIIRRDLEYISRHQARYFHENQQAELIPVEILNRLNYVLGKLTELINLWSSDGDDISRAKIETHFEKQSGGEKMKVKEEDFTIEKSDYRATHLQYVNNVLECLNLLQHSYEAIYKRLQETN